MKDWRGVGASTDSSLTEHSYEHSTDNADVRCCLAIG